MSGRGHRQVARYTGAPQGRRRHAPVRQRSQMGYQMGYQMGSPYQMGYQMVSPYQMVPYQVAPYQQMPYQMAPYQQMPDQVAPYQQMPYQVINNYQIINYQRAGYQSREHAMQCPHVQRAISTHGISRSSKLDSFLSMLASGLTIVASLLSIGIVL